MKYKQLTLPLPHILDTLSPRSSALYDFPFLWSQWAQLPRCGPLSLELCPEVQNKDTHSNRVTLNHHSAQDHILYSSISSSKTSSLLVTSHQKSPCSCLTQEHPGSCWITPRASVVISSKASEICRPSHSAGWGKASIPGQVA